jgi:SAM-dependent methyltransferase
MTTTRPNTQAGIDDIGLARRRVAERYRHGSRFDRGFIAGKLRHDPIYADLLAQVGSGFGHVLDIGCGRGQLGVFLLEAGVATSVLALDWNAGQIAQAQWAARGLPLRAEQRDLSVDPNLPEADTVFLIDILYQLDIETQRALFASAIRSARSRVVIRTPGPGRGLRATFTRTLEMLGRRVWPHSGEFVNPQPVTAFETALAAAGFSVNVGPCWRGTPFSNVLVIGQRG